MRVRLGWSGETQTNVWEKADVELDETDLVRVLMSAGLPQDSVMSQMRTQIAYTLLCNEAEFMLLGRLKEVGYPRDKANTRQNLLTGQNTAILGALKKAYDGE